MGQAPLFEIAGLGWPVVWVSVVLLIIGVSSAFRGFWSNDRRSRRLTVLAGVLVLSVAFVAGSFLLLEGFQQIARLGPAATPRDMGTVWRRALSGHHRCACVHRDWTRRGTRMGTGEVHA